MSLYYVLGECGYQQTFYPPHHDHWTYDCIDDAFYEDMPYHKEIHFFSYRDAQFNNYEDTERAIRMGIGYIETSQMALLSFDLQTQFGYDIYIHDGPDDYYLVSCDERQCERTIKQLRPAHNLEKMWAAGSFRKD